MIRTAVINELRRKGWSRYRLAKAMHEAYGCSETTIYGWLRGDRGVSVELVEGIFKVLGAKAVDLRVPEDPKPKPKRKAKAGGPGGRGSSTRAADAPA